MEAGLKKKWEKRRVRLVVTPSNSRDDATLGGYGLGAAEFKWTPNNSDVELGIRLAASSQLAGAGPITTTDHRYRLFVKDLYDFTEVRAGWASPISTHIIINNLRLYGDKTEQVRVKWDTIEWYIEGVLFHTVGAGEFYGSEITLCGIPIVGEPPEYSSSSGNDLTVPL